MDSNQLVFENSVVKNHSLYTCCHSTLLDLAKRDYPKENYYFNPKIACLDLDTYEKNVLHRSSPENTMDAAIGVASYVNGGKRNARLLLVELRMGYDSCRNLSCNELEKKILHTRSMLCDAKVDNADYFIFNETVAPVARNWFAAKGKSYMVLANSKVCSVLDFKEEILDFDDMPYVPIYSEDCVLKDLNRHIQNAEWQLFVSQIRYWCDLANALMYKKPSEFNSLKTVLHNFWMSFKKEDYRMTVDEKLDIEILEEDYDKILS